MLFLLRSTFSLVYLGKLGVIFCYDTRSVLNLLKALTLGQQNSYCIE